MCILYTHTHTIFGVCMCEWVWVCIDFGAKTGQPTGLNVRWLKHWILRGPYCSTFSIYIKENYPTFHIHFLHQTCRNAAGCLFTASLINNTDKNAYLALKGEKTGNTYFSIGWIWKHVTLSYLFTSSVLVPPLFFLIRLVGKRSHGIWLESVSLLIQTVLVYFSKQNSVLPKNK